MTKNEKSSQLREKENNLSEMTFKFNKRLLFAFHRENERRRLAGEKRLRQTDLWKAAGVTSAASTAWFKGDNGASLDTCFKLKDVLRCNPCWLYDESMGIDDELSPSSYTQVREKSVEYVFTPNVIPGPAIRGDVPLISWVQAGEWVDVVDNYLPGDSEERIPTTVPIKRHTYALKVKGDSMTNPNGWPSFPEGMIIIIEPEFDHEPGDFVIVKNGDNEATFKQLVKDGPDWFLKPLNPRYPIKPLPHDAIICGVVRGYGGMLR